jgi:hypothetical protein
MTYLSDRNRLKSQPDQQTQRLVIDTLMKQWSTRQSLEYVNRYLKKDGKREIKERQFFRIKQYMKDHQLDRLFEIAKEGFVSQHLDRIDDLISIKKEMWECYYKQKKADSYKAAQILAMLMQVQPYLSQYYEASKIIMRKVTEENRRSGNGQITNEIHSHYIP